MVRASTLLLAIVLAVPTTVRGVVYDAVIDEVMAGFNGDSSVQYVEIRMRSAGQNLVSGSRIGFFSCDGSTLVSSVIPGDVPNSGADVRWLMASPSFAAAFGIQPDFVLNMPMTVPARYPCGMVCWGNPTTASSANQYSDCVAYGDYHGTTPGSPIPPFAGTASSLAPGDGTMSLTRISDTQNNSVDFALRSPTPTNNSVIPTTTTTPGATTTTGSTTTTTFPPGTPLAGTKLVLKTNPKNAAKKSLTILLHGANIALGDPVGHGGGSVRVFTIAGDAFDDTYPLPANRWKLIAKGKGLKYVDPSGPIRLVIVKQGKMVKVTGLGGQLMDTLAANPDPMRVLISVGTEGYCAEFPGGKFTAGKKYIAGNSSPPASCP